MSFTTIAMNKLRKAVTNHKNNTSNASEDIGIAIKALLLLALPLNNAGHKIVRTNYKVPTSIMNRAAINKICIIYEPPKKPANKTK